ncbi:MAG: thiol reductant ABC exporter subunit CydD [Anaerolineales bacterium]|jgi:ATP-binding cassette subfamily C protein CydCD
MNLSRRLLSLASNSRTALLITILAGTLGGLLTIAQARSLSLVVNGVFIESQTLQSTSKLLYSLLIIFAVRSLLAWISEVSAKSVAVRVKEALRKHLFSHIAALGPSYTRRQRTGELTTAAVEGIETLDAYFSQYLPQLVLSAMVPLSILIFVFPLDPLSGLILLLTAPLIPVFMILIGKAAEALTRRQYESLNRLSAHFLDSLQGLTTLKIFGRSQSHGESIREVSEKYGTATMNVLRVTFLSALVLELVGTLSTAVIAVEVGLRLLDFNLGFSEAFFLLILAPEFYIPLRMLGLRFHAGMSGTTAARKIFAIFDIKPEERDAIGETQASPIELSEIEFSNVSFTYPDEAVPALQNISFTIKHGQKVALVGPSGAGKSTLAGLLLRFFYPVEGEILCNGSRLHEIHVGFWRNQIAWVPQDPFIFNQSVAENIRLGRPDAEMDEITKAAKAAHLHDFIVSLPDGYETLVGEAGSRLSSGQAQRLALARAYLKDAPFLILDEPTSSQDPRTEVALEKSCRQLMEGRTVITIAHRLNTIINADRILVLQKGRLVESGNHEELIARGGAYRQLMAAQIENVGSISPQWHTSPLEPVETQHISSQHMSITISQRLNIISRLLGFLRGSWGWIALATLIGSATIASSISLLGTSSWLISTAALHPSIAELQVAIVGVRFFGIFRGAARYLERLVSHRITFRILARLRTWFYATVEPLAPARLMTYHSGDLLSRVVADIETLENFYVRVVSPSLIALIVSLGTTAFLGLFDPLLGGSIFIFFFLVGLVIPLMIRIISSRTGKSLVTQRAALHTQLVENIQGLSDILAFGVVKDRQGKLAAVGRDFSTLQIRFAWITGFHTGIGIFLTNLGMWVALLIGIQAVDAGRLPAVLLAALVLVTLTSFEAVTPLSSAAQMLGETTEAARRLFEITDTQAEVEERKRVEILSSPFQNLCISKLSFTYPGSEFPGLRDVSLQLKAGEKIAIVGPSGAGKSTILNLLLRFWEFHQGEILLNGHSLQDYSSGDVRSLIAVVPQRPYFFNKSIGNNLSIGRPAAAESDIERAASQAHIGDFIRSLPEGYHTFIGERGFRLSGGERQRLAIARSVLTDAPILVLDEPTANLDPYTERQVLNTFFSLPRQKTLMLITHRLIGLENVDRIYVLDLGRIVEKGTQDLLLEQDGLYSKMFKVQNQLVK